MDYGIIGNCRTCALVKKDTSVDWMCYPKFSSPSVFARILDPDGGHLKIIPKVKSRIKQRYIPRSAVLETTFTSRQGKFRVIDFFPKDGPNCMVRLIRPVRGKPEIRCEFSPRPDYARKKPELHVKGNVITAGNFRLETNIPAHSIVSDQHFRLEHGKYLSFGDEGAGSLQKAMSLLYNTLRFWKEWTGDLFIPRYKRHYVIRSAITLKLLTYEKTGAIVAAPTTSLPEVVGSDRTFDYRYCWVRDSAFCVDVLNKIGKDDEAKALLEFILKRVARNGSHIMYGIEGETKLTEQELSHLEGYKGSRPVRIGNAAHSQLQLDVYGGVLDVIYLYYGYYRYTMPESSWKYVRFLVRQIEKKWKEKDSGIWEFRGEMKHYTYSKFMCYVGVDRAIRLAQIYRKYRLAGKWEALREEIKLDILEKGYDEEMQAFTMEYGGRDLDASLLQMTYHDFLTFDDPRIVNTVTNIYKRLRKGHLVKRYLVEDDFGVSTSAFTICGFWLVDSLFNIGKKNAARRMYSRLLRDSNHLGLFSEDIDLSTKKLRGNFPQAYTHLALINSSVLLSEWCAKRIPLRLDRLLKRSIG